VKKLATITEEAITLLGKEGWTRLQENAAKPTFDRSGRGGKSKIDHPACAG